jgi:hypothetical protein
MANQEGAANRAAHNEHSGCCAVVVGSTVTLKRLQRAGLKWTKMMICRLFNVQFELRKRRQRAAAIVKQRENEEAISSLMCFDLAAEMAK